MKYSNIKHLGKDKEGYKFATVDVTTEPFWPWNKPVTITMKVYNRGSFWRWYETGTKRDKFVPEELDYELSDILHTIIKWPENNNENA